MAFINDRVRDTEGLNEFTSLADRIDITSAEATTFSEATSTLTLGNKTSLSVGSPEDGSPDGRSVEVAAFSDGSVTADGTATHWAITDTANSRLLATGQLDSSQAVTTGNAFSLGAFTIRIPDAVND